MALPASRKRATPVDDDKDGGGSDARPRKRKKTRRGGGGGRSQKTQKMRSETAAATPSLATAPRDSAVKQDLLARYYPRVETLRAYLLTRLPASSRIRRKRLAAVGATAEPSAVEQLLSRLLDMTLVACGVSSSGDGNGDDDGDPPDGLPSLEERGDRERLRETFSQTKRADESYVTVSNAAEGAFSPQAEIVDFVVWLLFKRSKKASGFNGFSGFPENVLCHGFQRGQSFAFRDPAVFVAAATTAGAKPAAYPSCTISGLYAAKPTQNAQTLKEAPWPQLLALLGASSEKIMIDLLLDCSLFIPVDAGYGNFIQLTGKPLFEIVSADTGGQGTQTDAAAAKLKQPSDVTLLRSRMFYAKPSLTAAGAVQFGLKHIHVLNRFPYWPKLPENAPRGQTLASLNKTGTVHTAMYMFPRQFKLHNVFTSSIDRLETASRVKDYTLREKEIEAKFGAPTPQDPQDSDTKIPIPKRLRGAPLALIEKMRILHRRCAYYALLDHYCPVSQKDQPQGKSDPDTGSEALPPTEPAAAKAHDTTSSDTPVASQSDASKDAEDKPPQMKDMAPAGKEVSEQAADKNTTPLVHLATPLAQVSAFCRAVFQNVVPDGFWGAGDAQAHNKGEILKRVDSFVRLLRYETVGLYGLLQGLKIAEIEWLAPPGLRGSKMSKTDLQKRQEIFAELLYYLFDSFLVPLIRTNFYVTESNTHRNQLFYFRHDVWRRISEPAVAALKESRYEELKLSDAVRMIDSRGLGFGQLRLLPKQAALRAIMNLRHRAQKRGDTTRLASSANTVLRPVASMFNLEMEEHPERLGSGMLSTRNMYMRLKGFKQRMAAKKQHRFYFAKVDVKSAFDTIPQEAIVKVIGTVPEHPVYHIDQHVEIAGPELEACCGSALAPVKNRTTRRTWRSVAKGHGDTTGFHDSVEGSFALHKRNTVFVDSAFRKTRDAESLAKLAASHIMQNIVKIGKKYYRQKEGIPQGSVLSSTLCSYFYADLEEKELGFLRQGSGSTTAEGVAEEDCLLLRLIDDFLLITTDRSKAARFIEVMQRGHPRYGVAVNPRKSLVNFDVEFEGQAVPRLAAGNPLFPYCGAYIHCSTLNMTKDRETKEQAVFNSITVEHTHSQGYHFKRKVFSYFRIQSHHMFFDTSYNSRRTTLRNLHGAFTETANKMWAYARCMPQARRPSAQLTIGTIEELAEMAFGILSGKMRAQKWPQYEFSVPKAHLRYLLLHAFLGVLRKKPTGYKDVLAWLCGALRQMQDRDRPRLPKEYFL